MVVVLAMVDGGDGGNEDGDDGNDQNDGSGGGDGSDGDDKNGGGRVALVCFICVMNYPVGMLSTCAMRAAALVLFLFVAYPPELHRR